MTVKDCARAHRQDKYTDPQRTPLENKGMVNVVACARAKNV